jgi:hypothetical protein
VTRIVVFVCLFATCAGTARAQTLATVPTACSTANKSAEQSQPGSIRRAIASEKAGLASSAGTEHEENTPPEQFASASDWSRVTRLRPGTDVEVTAAGAPAGRRYVVHVDDATLTVLDTSLPSLPRGVAAELRTIAAEDPGVLQRALETSPYVHGRLRIEPGGVFHDDRRVAAITDVVIEIPRVDVLAVSRRVRRGSTIGAVAGSLAGLLVGLRTTGTLMFKQCGGSCNDEKALIGASLIGLPIAAGVLGYHVAVRTVDVIGYRAPGTN